MGSKSPVFSITSKLSELPSSWRALLIVVVVALGFGYAAAIVNLVGQNELVDGKPGLTSQDVVLKYHGGFVTSAGGAQSTRMLAMSNGEMRDEFETDDHHAIVKSWLEAGAVESEFDVGTPISPKGVFESDCTSCHSTTSGLDVAATSPFGADEETASFAMIAKFTAPTHEGMATVWQSPKSWRSLALGTHVHVLAVPLFVAFMGALFLWAGWPAGDAPWKRRARTLIAIGPLVAFLGDVSCWWLARLPGIGAAFALAIMAFGAAFAVTFVTQWSVVMSRLCHPMYIAARDTLMARSAFVRAYIEAHSKWRPAMAAAQQGYKSEMIDDKTFADLSRIDGEAAELAALLRETQQILDPTKYEHSVHAFNANEVLREVADRAASLIGGKPVQVQFAPSNATIMVDADRYQFTEILFELVANGIRNTDFGTVTLAACVAVDARLGEVVRISVKDASKESMRGGDPSALCEVSKTARISVGKLGGRLNVVDDDGTGNEFVAVFPLESVAGESSNADLVHAQV